jgi:arylsulfatase A-like enzyme
LAKAARQPQDPDAKNILILIFDALSAAHVSFHGYQRETTPNLARIAERAAVYYNHYAGGHWTYPATASLLTGVQPWTHRGLNTNRRLVSPFDQQNIFSLFENRHRAAYTHNPFADAVIRQFGASLDLHQPLETLYLGNLWVNRLFDQDYDTASVAWTRQSSRSDDGYANSLFLSNLFEYYDRRLLERYADEFPYGLPHVIEDNYFLLESAIDWILDQTASLPQPYLAYFHLYPPHDSYSPRREFAGRFAEDGYAPVEKPLLFNFELVPQHALEGERQKYDEYILNVDAEIGRLVAAMEQQGALENTWVVITSDHGELFERGMLGHRRHVFYEPLIRVPLLILEPGQVARRDIFSPTSALDLLPTLLHVAGEAIPDHLEGEILPPYAEQKTDRSIYAMDARANPPLEPLDRATFMLLRDTHKLVYHLGYEGMLKTDPFFELYDLKNDPEELENVYTQKSGVAAIMREELLEKLRQQDAPYHANLTPAE